MLLQVLARIRTERGLSERKQSLEMGLSAYALQMARRRMARSRGRSGPGRKVIEAAFKAYPEHSHELAAALRDASEPAA